MLEYKEPLSKRNKAETGIRYEWYAMQRWGAKYWDDLHISVIPTQAFRSYPPSLFPIKWHLVANL